MKRFLAYIILVYISLWTYPISLYAEKRSDCGGGDQDKNPTENPTPTPGDEASAALVTSGDPNELVGPAGFDTLKWVSINDVLHYTIYFENSEEIAGANAQVIDVRFRFPYEEMMNTFQLGEYNFALQNYPLPSKGNAYKLRLDLRDKMMIYVDVVAGLDIPQQQAYWHFSSIDPVSGFAPWQFDRGLLPVNDSTHIGEGYVTFTMQPAPSLHTGDTISFYADILFDQNDTIPTNWWRNRVDAEAPQSAIISVVDAENPLLYHLSFEAVDDLGGCGVKQIILYKTDHMGTWQEMATFSPDTTMDILLNLGESYKLISVAEDNVGNREPFKTTPDLILNANLPPTDILLSDSTFREDLSDDMFIATISSVDTEDGLFTYALAEGDNAIHNDFFLIDNDRLLLRDSRRCTEDTLFNVRISTTDQGGLSFAKPFTLRMQNVLPRPDIDTVMATVCVGESYPFHGDDYNESGVHRVSISNDYACDSVHILMLSVVPVPEQPTITIENDSTLVSSAADGNSWCFADGTPVPNATSQRFTPKESGRYTLRVNNGSCWSESSDTVSVKYYQDSISLTLNLVDGWNWFSSNLSDEENRNVQSFLSPIQLFVDSLCGNNPVVTTLSPLESYKIRVNPPIQHTWYGVACSPEQCQLLMQQGWNRIGYPLSYVSNLTNTWSDFQPEEGDVIKTYENFSVYHSGHWTGTLRALFPGDGIMYYAQSAKTMRFPSTNAHVEIQPLNSRSRIRENMPINTAIRRYPDNMTMIATLHDSAQAVPAGLYTVAAFSNNECVGIGTYVDNLIYMMMYGDVLVESPVSFRAYNNITGDVATITETTTFGPHLLGSAQMPYLLHLSALVTDIDYSSSSNYIVYPNPVRSSMYITGDASEILSINVYATLGERVLTFNSYESRGLDVTALQAGTYLVLIEATSGKYLRKITKLP